MRSLRQGFRESAQTNGLFDNAEQPEKRKTSNKRHGDLTAASTLQRGTPDIRRQLPSRLHMTLTLLISPVSLRLAAKS